MSIPTKPRCPVKHERKGQTGLSHKNWDKAFKGLAKNKLARVEKTDAGLLVSLVLEFLHEI